MSGVPPTTIQQQVESGLLTALQALDSTWRLSAYAYGSPETDTSSLEELSFQVGLGDTEMSGHKQSVAEGQRVAYTSVEVRMTRRLQADDQPGSYRTALGKEAELVKSIAGLSVVPLTINRIERPALAGDGTVYVCTVFCTALHGYPLA